MWLWETLDQAGQGVNANELWKQQLLSHVRHGAKLRRIKRSEIFLKYFYSRKTFLQTQLYNYQTPPLGRNYPWTSGKKIIFPYTRVTGFSRETLSWTASNARQLQTISPESFPRAVWSPPGENTSQVEGRSHVADPAITHDVGGYRKVHSRGLPTLPRQRPHNFPVPKWGWDHWRGEDL